MKAVILAGGLGSRISKKTKAIMPVHLLGNTANMSKIQDIANRHDLFVIEDSCEAHGAEFNGEKILITGGTGSLGTALTKRLLETDVETIRIFSRDKWKQVKIESEFTDKRLRFFIGGIRDKERLSPALKNSLPIFSLDTNNFQVFIKKCN